MKNNQVFYVGTESEVAHHATPLLDDVDIKIVEPHRVAALAKPNDLAIFFSEHFHRFRKAWLELNDIGCNTLYAIDGILEWRNAWENREDEPACPWTMRPILSDKVACIGDSQARVLNSWGNQGKCEVVGVPRFDRFGKGNATNQRSAPSDRFRVLVTTAKWPGFTDEQVAKITQSLIDLKQSIEQTGSINGRPIEVVWRLTGQLPATLGVTNQLSDTSGCELAEVIREVDAVITTPSTVMLEAMLQGRPVAILDYTNSPRYVDTAWSITAADQIDRTLQQLEAPSAPRMALQRSLLNDNLQRQQPATERLVQLIEAMTRIGHDCRIAGKPVQFPAQILPAKAEPKCFDANLLWPKHTELTKTAVEQEANNRAAVAAEALRRVDHLQARIDLLEHELAKAAEGFDRIANHPLLAPLVKVRKVARVMGSRVMEILRPNLEENKSDLSSRNPAIQQTTDPTSASPPVESTQNTLNANDVVRSDL